MLFADGAVSMWFALDRLNKLRNGSYTCVMLNSFQLRGGRGWGGVKKSVSEYSFSYNQSTMYFVHLYNVVQYKLRPSLQNSVGSLRTVTCGFLTHFWSNSAPEPGEGNGKSWEGNNVQVPTVEYQQTSPDNTNFQVLKWMHRVKYNIEWQSTHKVVLEKMTEAYAYDELSKLSQNYCGPWNIT